MQIKSIETFADDMLCFVRVTDADDAHGWALDSYNPQINIAEGKASVPAGPGWGFEPTADFLTRSVYAVSRV